MVAGDCLNLSVTRTLFQVRPAGSPSTSGRDLCALCHESPGSEREIRRGQEGDQPGGDLSCSTLLTPARRWGEALPAQVSAVVLNCITIFCYNILLPHLPQYHADTDIYQDFSQNLDT